MFPCGSSSGVGLANFDAFDEWFKGRWIYYTALTKSGVVNVDEIYLERD